MAQDGYIEHSARRHNGTNRGVTTQFLMVHRDVYGGYNFDGVDTRLRTRHRPSQSWFDSIANVYLERYHNGYAGVKA